jgi:hypothetical protein
MSKTAQPCIPLLPYEIPGHHLGKNFSQYQFFSQYQTNSFPVHAHFISNHSVNLRSARTSYLTRAVLSPYSVADVHLLRCVSSTRVLPSENLLWQQKACALDIVSSPKACWNFLCVVVVLSPSLTQKKRWHTVAQCLCFHFHDEVHKHPTCQAPTPHRGIAQPCPCKWGWRKDQGQRLSGLVDCSIAYTARRKSHYFIVGTCIIFVVQSRIRTLQC